LPIEHKHATLFLSRGKAARREFNSLLFVADPLGQKDSTLVNWKKTGLFSIPILNGVSALVLTLRFSFQDTLLISCFL
jgi:hypothetical protein